MISLHDPHLTHSPSGTRLSCWLGSSGVCSRRNHAMTTAPAVYYDKEARASGGLVGRRRVVLFLEVVVDAEHLARAVVDLLGGVLGVLELGQADLDVGQL